jgi:hypothetical protein
MAGIRERAAWHLGSFRQPCQQRIPAPLNYKALNQCGLSALVFKEVVSEALSFTR